MKSAVREVTSYSLALPLYGKRDARPGECGNSARSASAAGRCSRRRTSQRDLLPGEDPGGPKRFGTGAISASRFERGKQRDGLREPFLPVRPEDELTPFNPRRLEKAVYSMGKRSFPVVVDCRQWRKQELILASMRCPLRRAVAAATAWNE